MNETELQGLIRLEATRKGCRLWRNNVGATYTDKGDFIRFGLANESKKINDHIKSSDLIGIRPILITQNHVGKIIGQFLCREIKKNDWQFKGTEREIAQKRWIDLILSFGGDAAFANSEGSV